MGLFNLFKKKEFVSSNESKPKYYISQHSKSSKKYELIKDEELFFDKLLEKSTNLNGVFSLERLSNGTINVSYNRYPIGKIKLQGRKKYIMYLKNLYDPISVEGELEDLINQIDNWIKYIEKYL